MMKNKQNLKWYALALVVTFMTVMLIAGCGSESDSPTAGDAGEEATPDIPTIEGERYETDTVSMIIADGWDVMDISGGLQAYQGISKAVEVWVRGSGLADDAGQKSIENFASSYDGTEVEEIELFGLTFHATTYIFSGLEQTKFGAVKDGQQIEITLAGENHLDDDEIMGMFYSIILK
ncbi:MAG: hypothetical protein ACNA7Z_09535 [Dethiobacteria bacterium]|nr:hypothetical protein [Bacillota bacterium]